MKVGVAFYYQNIGQYHKEWVQQCIDSIANQTYKDFEVYVLDYGNDAKSAFDVPLNERFNFAIGKSNFINFNPLSNYAAAMNYIYSWIFETCDVAVNTNVDDFYDNRRIELLLQTLEQGADIASSNYHYVDENSKVTGSAKFAHQNVYNMLKKGFNPVSNPGHILHRRVFDKIQFDPSLVPVEDLSYWKKALELGFKISIRPEYLHYYRQHPGQSTHRR